MMRLPARLTAQWAKARVARILKSAAPSPLYCVDSAEVLRPGSDAPVSHEKMQMLLENPAPVIWIRGSEPLLHPGIGHFVRAVAQSRHFVFLETNGTLLRRRIHEFQPLPQVFLTVRLDRLDAPDSALAAEGLRAARLSGFFTVVHSVVREDSDIAELRGVRSFISENDTDGWLVTAALPDQVLARKAAEARGLIASWFWRRFSERVERALSSQTQDQELRSASPVEGPRREAREESVKVA
jgi:hypothetical protein